MEIRELQGSDLEAVLVMNNAAVPAVNPHDSASLDALIEMADRSWVVDDGGVVGAVLVTFAPGADYQSRNYRWLSQRYDDFRYTDRIVVATSHKRLGLGRRLYGAFEQAARVAGVARLVCEVNVEPPNPQSIAFHVDTGWLPIADHEHGPGEIVRFFEKPLA